MECKLSETTKPKNKKIQCSSNAPKIERVLLAGDFNSCMLVIPEPFGMHKNIALCQGGPSEYHV